MQRVVDMGVKVLNSKVDNILETMQAGQLTAAFLAVGAHIAKRAYIPSNEVSKVVDAVSVLRSRRRQADARTPRGRLWRRQYRH